MILKIKSITIAALLALAFYNPALAEDLTCLNVHKLNLYENPTEHPLAKPFGPSVCVFEVPELPGTLCVAFIADKLRFGGTSPLPHYSMYSMSCVPKQWGVFGG